jgi:NitT/TauT family transport system substrate-binding protein
MKEYGLVESGVALEHGIGCFDADQVSSFYDKMVQSGVLQAGINVGDIYTNQFVCKGVGMDLKN